jgi:putative alpha-1,2-mannosidase
MILDTMYSNKEDGLCGNDDAGQMSAWYIFSSLGFYPVLPGSDEYAIGSPMVNRATIRLDNGKEFVIESKNQGKKNIYVQKMELNGEELRGLKLRHSQIVEGGTLTFHMGKEPKISN